MKPIHLFPIFSIIFVTASGCVSENGQSGTCDNETEALLYQGRDSKVVDLNCVECWSFIAKWTGVKIADLFEEAGNYEMRVRLFFTARMDILPLLIRTT